jgi:C-terminal processing protease CtpA/Prc
VYDPLPSAGLLRVGDQIVMVNGLSALGMSHQETVDECLRLNRIKFGVVTPRRSGEDRSGEDRSG